MELNIAEAFIDTVDDLRKRSVLRGTEYDAVQASGLMRRLFLDQKKLMHQAAKMADTEINFRWYQIMQYATGRLIMATPMVDPMMGQLALQASSTIDEVGPPKNGKIDAFLKIVVVRYGGGADPLTAGQLVSHYANRMGGVHVDMEREVDSPSLREALDDAPEQLRMIVAALGRITVAALDPLASALYFKYHVRNDGS